ncbi:uroporphyrinogen decarboxylase family protein [Leptospira sp. GIMC2001]|uniref:uroporphyrinogen decarboxylase family protein n=1 Tax=Leptospira sp. GIMC2001 TaxID=1513297 RepID=UPI00234A9F38|nr:uroporphyrinogen decarboxylase family protein [Leptospira sp. GIMC2001]WCL49388.1 uroporphyrinogen decarboxylase [Leptospira sp. GIMC2001]
MTPNSSEKNSIDLGLGSQSKFEISEENKNIRYYNPLFANALRKIPQSTPPIWFMRQAGRYHSHYRKLKEKYSFMELCKNPELAAEVALGPVAEFQFDVSILFSDLLFPLEALGFGLTYNPGPILSKQLTDISELRNLHSLDDAVHFLEFQKVAMQKTRAILPDDVSLIGFVGGAWTLYSYATIGNHQGSIVKPKTNTDLIKGFYAKILPLLIENIRLQIIGGAEVVMVLDTSAGDLSPLQFQSYVVEPLSEITKQFPNRIGYYTKHSTKDQLILLQNVEGLAGIGVDHRFSIEKLMQEKVSNGFLQGNFDQTLLFLPYNEFEKAFRQYLRPIQNLSIEERAGWVSGLGHGILPATPEENVKRMVNIIREVFQ